MVIPGLPMYFRWLAVALCYILHVSTVGFNLLYSTYQQSPNLRKKFPLESKNQAQNPRIPKAPSDYTEMLLIIHQKN